MNATHEAATIRVATTNGYQQYTAALIHGPFAVIKLKQNDWHIIHLPTGLNVTSPRTRRSGYARRSTADNRIRQLLQSSVDWRDTDWQAIKHRWNAWQKERK